MPINLDALTRYHTIDKCLQNNHRKWTWEDLAKACFESLDSVRYRTEKNSVSKRTIENDIKILRSNILGYNAPIICKQGNYFYQDTNFSIKNVTLNENDARNISIASKILGYYKGFDFFKGLKGIFEKFEARLQTNADFHINKIIEFENIPDAEGAQFLNQLLTNIINKNVIEISYKKFESLETKKHIIHPYLLKEYRNRWYILGLNDKFNLITTYALDRIKHLEVLSATNFIENTIFDTDEYFCNTIGITYTGEMAENILLKVDADFAPYFISQPLHKSQQIIEKNTNHCLLRLKLVVNPELNTILMSYSNHIEVIEPLTLREAIFKKIKIAEEKYL